MRTHGRTSAAREVISAAVAEGIGYFDCARVYADSELYYGAVWGQRQADRRRIFQASKSASRDRKGALADLDQSLARLQCDYLDLWQIHDVRTSADLAAIAGSGGALEAFVAAKAAGNGHRCPPNTATGSSTGCARMRPGWPIIAACSNPLGQGEGSAPGACKHPER